MQNDNGKRLREEAAAELAAADDFALWCTEDKPPKQAEDFLQTSGTKSSRTFIGTWWRDSFEKPGTAVAEYEQRWRDGLANAESKIAFVRFNDETCPKTGRLHYQLCILTKSAHTLSAVHKWFQPKFNGWLAPARNKAAALNYCKKERTQGPLGCQEIGKEPPGQGHRTDWEAMRETAATKRRKVILKEDPQLMMQYKGAVNVVKELMDQELEPWGDWQITFVPNVQAQLIETRKTTAKEDIFMVSYDRQGNVCFDGYDDQPIVFIDEDAYHSNPWIASGIRLPIKISYTTTKLKATHIYVYKTLPRVSPLW